MNQTIGAVSDERADHILARCIEARPWLTPAAIENDMIRGLTLGCDDPDYFLSLLHAARRAQNGHRNGAQPAVTTFGEGEPEHTAHCSGQL